MNSINVDVRRNKDKKKLGDLQKQRCNEQSVEKAKTFSRFPWLYGYSEGLLDASRFFF